MSVTEVMGYVLKTGFYRNVGNGYVYKTQSGQILPKLCTSMSYVHEEAAL
jgi:hypothetical protein